MDYVSGRCKLIFVFAVLIHFYVSLFFTQPHYYRQLVTGFDSSMFYPSYLFGWKNGIPYTKNYEFARREAKR